MASSIVAVTFLIWAAVSVLVYIPALNGIIRGIDIFSVVPEWRFFAPNPGRNDFHLLFRDRFQDGSLGHWTELQTLTVRPWWHAFWNPHKRRNKALLDAVVELSSLIARLEPGVQVSLPYLAILSHVSDVRRSIPPEFVQFMIMYSSGTSQDVGPAVLYASQFHRLC